MSAYASCLIMIFMDILGSTHIKKDQRALEKLLEK